MAKTSEKFSFDFDHDNKPDKKPMVIGSFSSKQSEWHKLKGFDIHNAVLKPAPAPVSTQKPGNGWEVLASIAVGVAVVLVGVFAGLTFPDSGYRQ